MDYGNSPGFRAWQPSSWPEAPEEYEEKFKEALKKIFHESLLDEIRNVINDAPTLEHRGHVIALSILCAIDALSSYAFRDAGIYSCLTCGRTDRVGPRYEKYIAIFFPDDYQPYAKRIYKSYRNSITHSWNLFDAGMMPGDEQISEDSGIIVFGLKNFFNALEISVENFLRKLSENEAHQETALWRYRELKSRAKPLPINFCLPAVTGGDLSPIY
jgi:hypothetical protein